ncbi:hypothetical protein ACFQ9X_00905 [Catenulispora yoronensis]
MSPTDRVTTGVLVQPSTGMIPVRKSRALAGVGLIGIAVAWLVPAWIRNVQRRRAPAFRAGRFGAVPATNE